MITGTITIKDLKTGKERNFPMQSFVSNFLYLLYYLFNYDNTKPIDTDGESHFENDQYYQTSGVSSIEGDNDYGILIGDGQTAESCDQIDLAAKLVLDQTFTEVAEVYIDEQIAILEVIRTFSNTSGSSETINEIGMMLKYRYYSYGYLYHYIMLIRDKLSSGEVIADGAVRSIIFTISVTEGLNDNFLKIIRNLFYYGAGAVSLKDTDGDDTSIHISTIRGPLEIGAAIDEQTYGIQIGTDNTAIDISDYVLGAQLTTDWKYYSTQGLELSRDTGTGISEIKASRLFQNDTGVSVDVKEVGFVIKGNGAGERAMIARYLIGTIAVEHDETILIRIIIRTTM